MRRLYLFVVLPVALALPRASPDEISPGNKEKLEAALEKFGQENFSWPELQLAPHHVESGVVRKAQTLVITDLPPIQEVEDPAEDVEEDVVPEEPCADEVRFETVPEPSFVAPDRKAHMVLRHKVNDNPADPDRDAFLFTEADPNRPVCTFFRHSVLGLDFGESTFPRISYVGSNQLPYRVHYAPDDELRYESYRWPFAACNHGCELQALNIRAMFDWELDPVNEESPFDQATKEALLLAREICEWKNVHYYFAIMDVSPLRAKRSLGLSGGIAPGNATLVSAKESSATPFVVSGDVRAAINEIGGIFRANKGPQDIAAMFHTVIIACQIHHYTTTPMTELAIGAPGDMVQQAMSQITRVFAQTRGQIPVWETRDAIVRATQIYRYQEEREH
jgi:hypothetical protein